MPELPHTLSPTLTPAQALRRVWDAVVVGAGPAGCLAACLLARAGAEVLLVEKQRFPREKVCGGCLNAVALATLAECGLDRLVPDLQAPALRTARLGSHKRMAELTLPTGAAVSRPALDTALARAAVAAGAALWPGVAATLCPGHGAHREIRLAAHPQNLRARIVIAADGLSGGLLRTAPEFQRVVASNSRTGAGTRLAPTAGQAYVPGTVYMACGRFGYVGLVRVEDGRLDVAAAFDPEYVRRAGGPGPAAAGILAETGWPPLHELRNARWRGTPTLTRRRTPLAANRVFLIGDAAAFVEPFTGEGMSWALRSAVTLTPFVIRGLAGWSAELERQWSRAYRQALQARQRRCWQIARWLRHPRLTRAAVHLLALAPWCADPCLRALYRVDKT